MPCCGWRGGGQDAEVTAEAEPANRLDTRSRIKAKQERGVPLTPDVLSRMSAALERADLSSLVRRQSVCGLARKTMPKPRFCELFISIDDLRERVAPTVDLMSSPWLFQSLTETLDQRMLSLLSRDDRLSVSGDISINLNLSTLLSPAFLDFDDGLTARRRGRMIIELQQVDILADPAAFNFAREFGQEKGYRLCLDGVTHRTFDLMDVARLGLDVVKVRWDAAMRDDPAAWRDRFQGVQETAGTRVVLCRVDSPAAVEFGQAAGVSLFQGHHVETLISDDQQRRHVLRLKRGG